MKLKSCLLLLAMMSACAVSAGVYDDDTQSEVPVLKENIAIESAVLQAIAEKSAQSLGVAQRNLLNIKLSEDGRYVLVKYAYEKAKKKKTVYEVGVALLARNTFAPVWTLPDLKPAVMTYITSAGVLLYTPNGDTQMISFESDLELWMKEAPFLPCYFTDNLLIGYRNVASKKLKGIRLTDGEDVWETEVAHDGGWSLTQMADDHSLFIVADDLCRINLETGETLKLKCKPAISDGKRIVGTIAAGVAAGAMTGVALGMSFIPTSPTSDQRVNVTSTICPVPSDGMHLYGLCSNILSDGKLYYFSDRNKMRCFNESMEVVWEVELPDSHSARAFLIDRGDTFLMFNSGMAIRPGSEYYGSGTPYVASFSKADGSVLSFEPFAQEKECVRDFRIDDNGVTMVTETKIAYKPFDGALQVKEK